MILKELGSQQARQSSDQEVCPSKAIPAKEGQEEMERLAPLTEAFGPSTELTVKRHL